MVTETYHVPAISCGHCVMAIQRELKALEGVVDVKADEQTKQVTVTYQEPATPDAIAALMEEIGYPIAERLN
ncbi:MAG: heavy-metal-associated domain-containing protein [Ardenticatenia bacterium]|nr:heavy-metal-associated domain-containing protein [Ardenticatenia bacterium]